MRGCASLVGCCRLSRHTQRVRWLALWLVLGAGAPAVQVQAAEPRDIMITLRARQALSRDPQLNTLRLGVTVDHGVATLWGPIPSDQAGHRAREVLEAVRGVLEVRQEFYQASAPVLPPPLDIEANWARQRPRKPDPPPVLTGSPLPPQEEDDHWDGIHVVTRRKIEMLPEPEISRVDTPPRPGVSLLTPILIPPPDPALEAEAALRKQLNRIRSSDPRFWSVQIELIEGVVILKGRVREAEDRMILAQKLARLPGVTRVSTLGVRVSDGR